ncbi:MAG: trp operon repressor [Chlamydiae bacterium]|nr:trp operon repressor [Chlamydiota bacterium]
MNQGPWKAFIRLCEDMSHDQELSAFFDLFFTIEEKETLASRYLIIKALLEDKLTQREIANTYKVSISQITRGSNALKIISHKLKKALTSRM